MVSDSIHAAIRKKFNLRNRQFRTLPYCSGWKYNRNTLAQLFGQLGFNKGAEIGVRRGRYSEMLCKCNPNLELFSIDPWEGIDSKYTQERQDINYQIAVKRLAPYNVKMIKKTSMDALADFPDGSLDFVYIDGDHHFDFICMDIICWSKKVRRNGIVGVHDFYNAEVGIVKAVEAYVHSHNIVPWYVTKELEPTAYWVNP